MIPKKERRHAKVSQSPLVNVINPLTFIYSNSTTRLTFPLNSEPVLVRTEIPNCTNTALQNQCLGHVKWSASSPLHSPLSDELPFDVVFYVRGFGQ